jgi:gliding motility-associated-like protein
VVRDTIKVTRDNLDILPGRDTLLCRGASVNLAANITSGTAPPITFSWFPGIGLNCSNCSSPVASPPVTTAYVVTVSDANSCTVHDTVSLSVNYVDINTAASTLMCPGAGYNLTSSISANASPVSYAWSPSAGLNCSSCASPLATPSVTTQYQLTVTDSSGCNGFAIVKVALDTIKLSHLYDTVICKDYPVTLALQATTAGSSLFYSWTPAAGLDCSNCAQPIATPQDTVVYVVHVTDDIGCSNTDSIKITIDLCNVSVPTAFTPNGDGKNDIIRVVGSLDFVRAFSFGIYNRFGQQVFYTEDIHSGWDGTLNGVAVDLGTYFYLVQYKLYNDPHILKGDFQLIR